MEEADEALVIALLAGFEAGEVFEGGGFLEAGLDGVGGAEGKVAIFAFGAGDPFGLLGHFDFEEPGLASGVAAHAPGGHDELFDGFGFDGGLGIVFAEETGAKFDEELFGLGGQRLAVLGVEVVFDGIFRGPGFAGGRLGSAEGSVLAGCVFTFLG